MLISKLPEYRKAVAAFVAPVLPLIAVALEDGQVTVTEWLVIVGGVLGIGGLVTAVPNAIKGSSSTTISVPLPTADDVPDEGIDEARLGL